jgi:cytochrome o ubiquinol oxidase subunit 3
MYVRSFKPAHSHGTATDLGLTLFHVLAVSAAMGVSFISVIPGFLDMLENGTGFGAYLSHHTIPLIILAVAGAVIGWFAKTNDAPDFDQRNAIDVEAIGLYWHFVDIVWIVIFTAVYLIEYL